MNISGYLAEIQKIQASGKATEHSYRPALEKLFKSIDTAVNCINEPKGVKVGRPDFVFTRNIGKGTELTVGHCEAKDVGLDISPKAMNDFNKAQHGRYVKALPNLIYTNGLDFDFYKEGHLARQISIADYLIGIQPKPDQFSVLEHQLKDFAQQKLQTITSAEDLAKMMAGKAVLIKDILFNSLKEDNELQTDLTGQYNSFKDMLIHDLSVEDFADIYSETIAYGMFGARLHDKTMDDFSRAEALELMPKSNPFLRNLFTYVAGPQLDERIRRTVDELAEIFQATNLQKLFEDFGKFTQRNDPFIHFYETFLAQYNPAKRKARGVWYTPEPVVNFIVRAVDDVLKSEFGLPLGLADTSKVTVDWDTGQTDNKGKAITIKKEVHRVQILDPAAGTGTFLAEVIKQIAPKVKDVAAGQWSSYVEKELIPRLHGFELLMASYAMCHMKLDMTLTEMGYKPTGNPPRLGVYLTNSLEEGERANQTLPFAQWLSNEAKEANTIKRDMPIMCVIGNPPYSGQSSNKGPWASQLVEVYKLEPSSLKRLDERNSKWLNDDYVKFLRLAEYFIERNGEGIVGFITNHGYIDNPTFRGMRWHLMKSFDAIYVLDLHGSSKKIERSPIEESDENVFDIQQGVAIIVAVKKANFGNKTSEKVLGKVYRGDLWGKRETKYQKLWESNLLNLGYRHIRIDAPHYPFFERDEANGRTYELGFSLVRFLTENTTGIQSRSEEKFIDFSANTLSNSLKNEFSAQSFKVVPFTHKPFDQRFFAFFANPAAGMKSGKIPMSYRARYSVSHHLLQPNLALLFGRSNKSDLTDHFFVSRYMSDVKCAERSTGSMFAPLYLYPDQYSLDQTRRVNFDPKIHKLIIAAATDASRPVALAPKGKLKVPDELAIFDYIYGVLHCPAYRETYKEFLKIDFPRVPYPASSDVFWDISAKGTQLRKLHLMEDAAIGAAAYKFTGQGDSVVGKVSYEGGVVRINATQGFEGVPEIAWNFYIGGYQPAQKWLKDRKTRSLSFDDIRHYQKIIKILSETDRIMKTITMPL